MLNVFNKTSKSHSKNKSSAGTSKSFAIEQNVARKTLVWMFAAQIISIFPLFFFLAIWIPVVWGFTLFWRIQIHRGVWPFPRVGLKITLGVISITGLVISYAGSFGVEPMVAFLVSSFSLKLLEVRKPKDVILVLSVGFFAIAALFLFMQGPWITLYGIFACVVNFAAWEAVYRKGDTKVLTQLRSGAVLILQALPVMVILFLVVPRLNPLWNIPTVSGGGTTGFSEVMSPGDLSNLAQSNETAFRVTFKDEIPPPSQMYWRGLVLDNFNGRSWEEGRPVSWFSGVRSGSEPHPQWGLVVDENSLKYDYTVLLEPHQHHWLFTLEAPLSIDTKLTDVGLGPNLLSYARRPVASRLQYSASSVSSYRTRLALGEYERRFLTRLPREYNPETQALAKSWRAQGLNDSQIIEQALTLFNQSFGYTLSPPTLGRDSVDEFLFGSKRGFCEHFSSAFVVLMRAADIPARVVVGYQGGQLRENEGYIIVRQADAHAWTEVWLPDTGWTRVDPTAAVSPERIEYGLEAALSAVEANLIDGAVFRSGALSWVSQLQLFADFIDYRWASTVLSYDNDQQAGVLSKLLGGTDPVRVMVFLLSTIGLILLAYYLYFNFTGKRANSRVEYAVYLRLCRKLARQNITPEAGETPKAFFARASKALPKQAHQIKQFSEAFERLVYADDSAQLARLKALVKQF